MTVPSVALLVIFPELIHAKFVVETLVPLMGLPHISMLLTKIGMRSEYAREVLIRQFLEMPEYEWLFIVDCDMLIPQDALPKLLNSGKKVISGLYFSRGDRTWPIVFREEEPVGRFPMSRWFDYPDGGVYPVGATGHGCLLIHKSVLEQLEPPYSQLGPFMDEPLVGSDVRLCLKIRDETNEKIWCDFSVRCGHLTTRAVEEKDWEAIKEQSIAEWTNYLREREK